MAFLFICMWRVHVVYLTKVLISEVGHFTTLIHTEEGTQLLVWNGLIQTCYNFIRNDTSAAGSRDVTDNTSTSTATTTSLWLKPLCETTPYTITLRKVLFKLKTSKVKSMSRT